MRWLLVTALLSGGFASAAPLPRTVMTVDLRKAQLSHFFRLVAEKADANLVIDDCAGGKITDVRVRNARLDEIVALVAAQQHVLVEYDGSTISVSCFE